MACSPLEINRRFDGIFGLQFQGVGISQARNHHETGISDDGAVLTAFFMLVSCLTYYSTLKKEATCSSVTSIDFQRTILPYVAEDRTHNNNDNNHHHPCTELCSGATNSPVSYYADVGFGCVPRDSISCLWMCSGFPQFPHTNVKLEFIIGHSPFLSQILHSLVVIIWSRDSSVGTATGYGLNDRGVGVRVPVGQEFSLLHVVQTGSGVHPTSYPMGTRGSFPGGKAAGP
jgi:hypothetical protein